MFFVWLMCWVEMGWTSDTWGPHVILLVLLPCSLLSLLRLLQPLSPLLHAFFARVFAARLHVRSHGLPLLRTARPLAAAPPCSRSHWHGFSMPARLTSSASSRGRRPQRRVSSARPLLLCILAAAAAGPQHSEATGLSSFARAAASLCSVPA